MMATSLLHKQWPMHSQGCERITSSHISHISHTCYIIITSQWPMHSQGCEALPQAVGGDGEDRRQKRQAVGGPMMMALGIGISISIGLGMRDLHSNLNILNIDILGHPCGVSGGSGVRNLHLNLLPSCLITVQICFVMWINHLMQDRLHCLLTDLDGSSHRSDI